MTPASLLCALALQATPASTPASSGADAPVQGAIWLNAGGVALTAISQAKTILLPLGATIPIPNGPTLAFELTYFRWTCTGTASCSVSLQDGVVATAGFQFDTEGKGPLQGFFLAPKLQLSTLSRTFFDPTFAVLSGRSFGLELGLDLGYQFRAGPLYAALMVGVSGGLATRYSMGIYGMLVEWNGAAGPRGAPQPYAPVFGVNGNLLRLGFTF